MFRARYILLNLIIGLLAAGYTSSAQQRYEVPKDFLPKFEAPRYNQDTNIQRGGVTPFIPEGADKIFMRLTALSLRGLPPQMTIQENQLRYLWQAKLGSMVSLAELYQLANVVEQIIVRQGYPLVRVTIPPQNLDPKGADVILQVVSGAISKIVVTGVDANKTAMIEKFLTPLQVQTLLTSAELERRILLAGSIAGITLNSSLSADNDASGSVLLLVQAQYKPISTSWQFTNNVSESFGGDSMTYTIAEQSVASAAEALSASFSGDVTSDGFWRSNQPSQSQSLVFTKPLGVDGLSLYLSAFRMQGHPVGNLTDLDSYYQSTRFSANILWPIILQRRKNLTLSGGIEWIDEDNISKVTGSDVYLYHDRLLLGQVKLAATDCSLAQTCLNANVELKQGIPLGITRGRDNASLDEPLSHADGDNDRTNLTASFGVLQKLGFDPNQSLSLQTGFGYGFGNTMLSSQNYNPVANGQISGFIERPASGDKGWWLRAEWRDQLTPNASVYSFGSGGASYLEHPSAAEAGHIVSQSAGIGLSSTLMLGETFQGKWQSELAKLWSSDTAITDNYRWNANFTISY